MPGVALSDRTLYRKIQKIQRTPGPAGADGSDGAPGAAGDPGSIITSGTAAPDNGDGNDIDVYLQVDADGVVLKTYQKAAGVWVEIGEVWTDTINTSTPADHYIFPNGIIFQWGVDSVPGDNSGGVSDFLDITFPIEFPNAFLAAIVSPKTGPSPGEAYSASYTQVSATGMRLLVRWIQNNPGDTAGIVRGFIGSGDSITANVGWLAIGY